MFFPRWLLPLAALMLFALSDGGFAAERSYGVVTKSERSLRGTWYSASGAITFRNNGTINYKGKRYFYAVSNGGIIQLSGKNRVNAIPYQLSGAKLTLIENGKVTVYTRNRQ